MRVIQRAKRRETARTTCQHCHSVLEYTQSDVKVSQQYNEEENWINCPVCGAVITVNLANAFPWVDPAGYYEDN